MSRDRFSGSSDRASDRASAGTATAESHRFEPAWRRGLYEAIARRRDMRSFLPDPIPTATLARVLHAAHQAPSVGFMQPWSFLVIGDRDVRAAVHAHVDERRRAAAAVFDGARRDRYLAYKLEGILDAPLNLCVTCDPSRHGPHVLGRHTIPETDRLSTCLAVQNLWLAARAEGLGVGWVSILEPARLREILGIPEHVHPVAYLCIGYVESFPERPMLESTGWLARLPLSRLVHGDRWQDPPAVDLVNALDEEERAPSRFLDAADRDPP